MKTSIKIIAFIIVTLEISYAQVSPGWHNVTNSDMITDFAGYQNYLWISLRGGVIRYNINSQSITKYTIKDGLTANEINGIAVAPNGNIFICGSHSCGISKFDGVNWTKILAPGATPVLEMSNWAILSDSIGNIYTGGYKIVNTTWNNLNSCAGGVNLDALSLDSNNNIWFVGGSICRYNGVTFTTFDTINSEIKSNSGSDVCVDNLGKVWIAHDYGSQRGLSCYNPYNNQWQIFDTSNSDMPTDIVKKIAVDNNNNLWAIFYPYQGRNFNIIGRFNGSSWIVFDSTSLPILTSEKTLTNIYYNSYDSAIYIGTTPYGLCNQNFYFTGGGKILRFKNNVWSIIDIGINDIPSWDITSLKKDNSGRIFSGFTMGGISIFDNNNWVNYNPLNSPLTNPWILDLSVNNNLNLWAISTAYSYSGQGCGAYVYPTLAKFDGNQWSVFNYQYTLTDTIKVNNLRICGTDIQGNFWFGTTGTTVKYDGSSWSKIDTLQVIKKIIPDNFGNIWFKSDYNVVKYNGTEYLFYNSSNTPLPNSPITDIDVDTVGNLWVLISNTKQVYKFNGTAWTNGSNTTSCGYGSNMTCIGANRGGDYVWVGRYGCGLFRTNLAVWDQFTTRTSGLNYNYVTKIYVDRNNVKYFLTGNLSGFTVYREDSLVGIHQSNNFSIPNSFSIHQNYPNPFNPVTKIRFDVPKPTFVNLIIYDILGKEVAALVNEELKAGEYSVDWNALNYPSGVYFYKLAAGEFSETKKMVLLK